MADVQPVRALARGLRLLEALAGSDRPLGVVEVARVSELSAATAHRLLATLNSEGYVRQDATHGSYRLGPRLFALAAAAESDLTGLRSRALPVMRALRDDLGETVNLAVLDRGHVIFVDQVESDRPLRAFNRIGNRVPAHGSAAGKVLLAHEPRRVLDEIASGPPLAALTASTVTSPGDFVAHLAAVKQQGFAYDLGEHDEDVICVAAPIPPSGGRAAGAISVSGPAERMRRNQLEAIGATVVAHVRRM